MIYSGLVSKTLKEKTLREVIAITKKANLKGIEWSSDCHLHKGDVDTAMEIRALCQENQIEIAGYSSYYRLGEYEDYESEFQQYLRCAVIIKAPLIRIWAGKLGSLSVTKEDRQRLVEEAITISVLAQQSGVLLSYEFHANTLTDTLPSTLDLLDAVPLSSTHWQIPNGYQLDENMNNILHIKDRLSNIHVQNCVDHVYYPLSDNQDAWQQYLQLIHQANPTYIRYACIEFVKDGTDTQLISDAKCLNDMISLTCI